MRILVVTQYFWPENFRINDLVVELTNNGHEIHILTGQPNYPQGYLFPEYKKSPGSYSTYKGIKIFRTPILPRGNGSMRLVGNYISFVISACSVGLWKLHGQEYDVVFIYEPSPITVAIPAILIGKLMRLPVVFWVLDLWPETLAAIGVVKSDLILKIVGILVRFIYENCTLILGQSKSFVSAISNYCSDHNKIRYYPSWSEDIFIDDKCEKAPEIPSLPDSFNIVFAGNLGEAQDFPSILDAAELLKNEVQLRWIIVGSGRKFSWIQSEITRRGLTNSFILTGSFPIERMPSFYAHADAFLVSLKDYSVFSMTIPAKLQTYFSSGRPILGMLNGEGARAIEESKSGLSCPAGDSAGLAKAISVLMKKSKKELQEMGSNGKAYSKKEFDRATLIKSLEDFFSEAIYLHGIKK